jgi:hypothetical protein
MQHPLVGKNTRLWNYAAAMAKKKNTIQHFFQPGVQILAR